MVKDSDKNAVVSFLNKEKNVNKDKLINPAKVGKMSRLGNRVKPAELNQSFDQS